MLQSTKLYCLVINDINQNQKIIADQSQHFYKQSEIYDKEFNFVPLTV